LPSSELAFTRRSGRDQDYPDQATHKRRMWVAQTGREADDRGSQKIANAETTTRSRAQCSPVISMATSTFLQPAKKTKEQPPGGGDPARNLFINAVGWWINSILHLDCLMATNDTPRTIYLPSTGGYTSSLTLVGRLTGIPSDPGSLPCHGRDTVMIVGLCLNPSLCDCPDVLEPHFLPSL
jgi:hypothetical protein